MSVSAINVDDLFLHHRLTLIHTIARIVGCPQTAEEFGASRTFIGSINIQYEVGCG